MCDAGLVCVCVCDMLLAILAAATWLVSAEEAYISHRFMHKETNERLPGNLLVS